MSAIIARTQMTPITMPAIGPAETLVRVWDEALEVGMMVAVGLAGTVVGEEVECVKISIGFGNSVAVALLGGRAMEPVVTMFL